MVHEVDERLRREAIRFALVFGCRDCAQFDQEGVRCSLGFPIEPHLDVDLRTATEVTFCKAFELV